MRSRRGADAENIHHARGTVSRPVDLRFIITFSPAPRGPVDTVASVSRDAYSRSSRDRRVRCVQIERKKGQDTYPMPARFFHQTIEFETRKPYLIMRICTFNQLLMTIARQRSCIRDSVRRCTGVWNIYYMGEHVARTWRAIKWKNGIDVRTRLLSSRTMHLRRRLKFSGQRGKRCCIYAQREIRDPPCLLIKLFISGFN